MLGNFKPGSKLLLAVGVTLWLIMTLVGQTPLERRLYDFQYVVAKEQQGPLASPLVAVAIDRLAFRAGFRDDQLPEIVARLPGTAVDIAHQELEPFFETDPDGMLRRVKLYLKKDSQLVLAPPLEVYLRFRGLDPQKAEIGKEGIRVGDEFIPTDSEGRYHPVLPLTNRLDPGFMAFFSSETLFKLLYPNTQELAFVDHLRPVSLVHLMQGEADLSDRLVLVGVQLNEAETIEFDTPGGQMARLELYTSLVDSLFKGNSLRPLGALWSAALSFLFLCLLALFLRGRQTLNSVGWWMLWTTAWLATHQLLFRYHYFAPQSPILLAGFAMLLVHLLRRSWRVRALLQSLGGTAPLDRTGEEIEATIMFTNLPDTIKDLEDSDPERAQAARAAHSRCVGYLMNQYGGRLVDLQGDAQMLAFGLEGVGDHRQQAVGCALEIVRSVSALLDTEEEAVHCGIVTGPVAVGLVGGGQYHGVAAIGDTTNSAARLMGKAKKLGVPVLASEETVIPLGPRAQVEKVGELTVKGREKPLEAWRVNEFSLPPLPPVADVAGSHRLPILAFVVSLFLEAGLILFLNQTLPLESLLLDNLTRTHTPSPVLFAGLDNESMDAQPWPWPRSMHAQIAKNCFQAGAKAVFLDFLFEAPSTAAEDQKLTEFVKTEPRLVVAAAAIPDELHQPQMPEILPELLASEQWALINHSPLNEGNRMRYGLWEMKLTGKAVAPGVSKKISEVIGHESPRMSGLNDFLIRWGPLPDEVSYHRLLNPEDPIFQSMNGKVVLAGANLDDSTDAFETPVGRLQGVQIHALSLATVLNDEVLLEVQNSIFSFLFAFLFGAAILYISWQAEGAGSQFALLIGGSVVAVIIIRFVAKAGYFLGAKLLWAVPVAIVLARIVAVLDAGRAVGQYIPRKLQERLETEGTVADVVTTGTILLTDIRGYTTLSEGRSPKEILSLLNSYHDKTAKIYEEFGGHLLTYQGDAQIVVFGPMQKVRNPVVNAIKAAQGIPAVLEAVAAEAEMEPGVLRVGAGITTGRITLSLLGIAGQLQYSVFGSPVRRAHHLQSLSDSLSDSIILDIRSWFEAKDDIALKRHEAETGETFYTV